MPAQVALAELGPVLVIGIAQLRHADVGLDAAFLHAAARRREVAGGRQLERGRVAQGQHRLHRSLAEAALAHHQRAMLVLQRAGDDFGRRCRTCVDQHDHRQALRVVARLGVIAFDIALLPAALRHDLAALQEGVADRHGLVQQAAGIGAQVQHIAGRLVAQALVDAADRLAHVGPGIGRETDDGDDADILLHLPLDGLELDDLARQRQVDRLVAARAHQRQLQAGAGRAAHLVDRLVQRAAIDELAIDMGDIIAGLDPRAPGGGVLRRRDHLDRAILLRDRQAQAAIAALGLGAQILEVARVEEAGMGVEAGEHAVDRTLDQLFVVDLLDIIGADLLEHVHEFIERLVARRLPIGERGRGGGDERKRPERDRALEEGGFHGCPRSPHQVPDIRRFAGQRKSALRPMSCSDDERGVNGGAVDRKTSAFGAITPARRGELYPQAARCGAVRR